MKVRSLLIVTSLLLYISAASAQGGLLDKIKDLTTKTGVPSGGSQSYYWGKINVNASWQDSAGEKIYQRRVYYTQIEKTSYDRHMKENLIEYFNKGVVEPLEAKGVTMQYYDSDVQVFPMSYSYASVQEAQEEMTKRLEADKSNERYIYTFTWRPGTVPDGENTTKPTPVQYDRSSAQP